MADQYPKQRHRHEQPAQSDAQTRRGPARALSESEEEYTAEQKERFLELFGSDGLEFFRDLHSNGLIQGWRCLRNVHSLSEATPPPDDAFLFP